MGAVLGGLLAQLSTSLCMVLLGAIVGWRWWNSRAARATAPGAEFDASTLLRRVVVLEREVNVLRKAVADLREPPAAVDETPRAVAAEPTNGAAPAWFD